MDWLSIILGGTKLLLVVSTSTCIFFRGIQLLIQHEEFRIRTFALGLTFGDVGIGLYLMFPEFVTIVRLNPILVNVLASSSIAVSVLLVSMTFLFFPKEPRKSIIFSIMIGSLVGLFMGAALLRMARGETPFYLLLLMGKTPPVEIRELVMGFLLIFCGVLILHETIKNLLNRLNLINNLKSERNIIIFSIAEIGSGLGIILFGSSLVFPNDILLILFQVAATVVLMAAALLSLSAKGPQPIPFTSYLKLKKDLLSSNPTLGWVFYVFGRMGPEPYLEFTNNLQNLSERERIEFIMEMGIKSMSLMTFGDRFIRSSVKINIQEPFEGTALYIGRLGRTETLLDEFDVRFEGRPYVGFLFIIHNDSTWVVDKTSHWEQFFEALTERYAIEDLCVKLINQELMKLLYSIIAD